ncbi:hypothetical protein DCE94_05240 [Agromyces badenianii]|nr:hypothetical protein DCE94_05240 [Agromyces badenianii]
MNDTVHDVFVVLPEVIDGYIDQDEPRREMRVRKTDGRIATFRFDDELVRHGVAKAQPDGELGWFGEREWSPARRWVALISVHVEEALLAGDTSHATQYAQVAFGFAPA